MTGPGREPHWADGLTLALLPAEAARRFGDREALRFRDRRYSFREVAAEVDRLAAGFIRLGVTPGERACLWLNNCPEWMFAMFALARIGAVHVPINTRFRVADLEYVLRQSEAATLLTDDVSGPVDYLGMVRQLVPAPGDPADLTVRSAAFPSLRRIVARTERAHAGVHRWPDVREAGGAVDAAAVAARAAAVRPTDTTLILYTSGTTGFPKGAMRDHRLLPSLVDRLRRLGTTERDVIINYLPLFHVFGYVEGPLGTLLGGHRQVLTETFDPDEALDLVEREGGTLLSGFDTHVKALCDAQEARPRDLRTLRTGIFAAGAASAAPIVRRARTVLAPMRHLTAYGITEAGANVTMSDLDATEEQACETSGYPCPGFEVRIVDPDTGADLPPGEAGELLVRSAYGMQGYYGKPEETARALDREGWFHTGDMARRRPDGYVRFLGRYKDMLKVGGENVDPVEVEAYLLRHAAVREVAVVSAPDPRLTEVPAAFVIRHDGAAVTAEELIAGCRGGIAGFKIPRHVFFVDALPITSSGKVRKAELRAEAQRRLDPA